MPNNDDQRSFWDHLDELRSVLLRSLVAWAVTTGVVFALKDYVFAALFAPARPDFPLYRLLQRISPSFMQDEMPELSLLNIDLTGQFMMHLEVSVWLGLVLALPVLVWQVYRFISPALYQNERRYVLRLMLPSALLFLLGVMMSYCLIFPLSFRFLSLYSVDALVVNQISLGSYISALLILSILMGILFQVPVLTWALSAMGLVTAEMLCHARSYVLIGVLIVAAIITPTGDVLTLMLVTIPVMLLYELGILLARVR